MSVPFEQALFHRADHEAPSLVARSPGFSDDWLPDALRLVLGFGNRPAGTPCGHAVFSQRLTKKQAAIVRVMDQEINGRRGLAYLVSSVAYSTYIKWLGDPFWIAAQLPANWQARGEMPQLTLLSPPPVRTVRDLQLVLQRVKGTPLREDIEAEGAERTVDNSESPALLGGVQILVDGGCVVFERPTSASGMIEALWTLLPHSTRAALWPANFAFCNDLRFDALVVPRAFGESYHGYADEEQAADYPEGRYEYRLQRAAEAGDQAEIDALLSRRSVNETWKLALGLLVFLSILVFVTNFGRLPQGEPPPPPTEHENKATLAAGAVSAADPWSALSLLQIGNEKWRRSADQLPLRD